MGTFTATQSTRNVRIQFTGIAFTSSLFFLCSNKSLLSSGTESKSSYSIRLNSTPGLAALHKCPTLPANIYSEPCHERIENDFHPWCTRT